MTRRSVVGFADTAIPNEPGILDSKRQVALTTQYLLPALPELEAFFLAVRAHLDGILQPLQPVMLGKAYPLGQCLEISLAALRELRRADVGEIAQSPAAKAGYAAFAAFRKSGGMLRRVWGDLRGEFFQNAFQLGSLYLDVSNDTVTLTKPKVEILPFWQARLSPISDYRHYARLASRYWKHRIYPNHVLPELAPYCPMVEITPNGWMLLASRTDYMIAMTQAKRFTPSEDMVSSDAMPDEVFDRVVQALKDSPWKLPASAEGGRKLALRACREHRERWHVMRHHKMKLMDMALDINNRLLQDTKAQPYADQSQSFAPAPASGSGPAMGEISKINVNGVSYDMATLSEEARQNVDNLLVIEARIAGLQRELTMQQASRNACREALVKALPAALQLDAQ